MFFKSVGTETQQTSNKTVHFRLSATVCSKIHHLQKERMNFEMSKEALFQEILNSCWWRTAKSFRVTVP